MADSPYLSLAVFVVMLFVITLPLTYYYRRWRNVAGYIDYNNLGNYYGNHVTEVLPKPVKK
jgi:hypothetical protein